MRDEELVASGRHDDCAMRTIRATMTRTADDAEHRSSSLTLSQWLMLLNGQSWNGKRLCKLAGLRRVCPLSDDRNNKGLPPGVTAESD